MKYRILDFYQDIYKMGLFVEGRILNVKVEADTDNLSLLIYKRNQKNYFLKIDFPKENKFGNIWILSLEFEEILSADLEYNFSTKEGKVFCDPYSKVFSGRDTFGKEYQSPLRSKLFLEKYDWQQDKKPQIDIKDNIIYRLNVRTFTKSSSSSVIQKGTFKGLTEKLDYIKDLGFNTILLMPSYEFNELRKDKKLNIWGYEKSQYFAPKASFCSKKNRKVDFEYKDMVKAFHKNNIEVWQEFYFYEYNPSFILEVLRFWVFEYHIDGVYINSNFDISFISNDAYLSKTKIIANNTDPNLNIKSNNLISYTNNFQNSLRKYLKADEASLYEAFLEIKSNPKIKRIKYMADIQGFSLMDVFSYDIKHNEDNKEDNKDGSLYNYSWNCGKEGETKNKKILELREKLYRNALVFLFLSQSLPLLCAGDEFGDSKNGNNNAYCQDNEISYINWKKANKYPKRIEFVKKLIEFRKKHKMFTKDEEFTMLDSLSCGMPDLSVHGIEAWKNNFEPYDRQLALYYSGRYYKNENDIYIIYNMHWDKHKFALPKIEHNKSWYLVFDTAKLYKEDYFVEHKKLLKNKEILVDARSIVCLIVK